MLFKIDATIEKDSEFVLDLELSQVRIINNCHFPWVLVIPRLTDIVEITDLSGEQYQLLNAEIFKVAKVMQNLFTPDKLNIATLGNKVRQMHYHIVARYNKDICFPNPVWGHEMVTYKLEILQIHVKNIRDKLKNIKI